MRGIFIAAFTALLALSPLRSANADVFRFKDAPQDTPETARVISDPGRAQRFFGRLDGKDDVDYFSITAEKDAAIALSLEVPSADKDFHPVLIFFGPGLPRPAEDPAIPIGDPNGAIVTREPEDNLVNRFDQFLFTTFLERARLEVTAPKQATYGIAVKEPAGVKGRYVLRIGSKDEFAWSELLGRMRGVLKAMLRMY